MRRLLATLTVLILPLAQAAENPGASSPPPAESSAQAPPVSAPAADQTPDSAPDETALRRLIDRVAREQQLDPMLVHALIRTESGYDPRAVSPKGAVGLMQLMPETAADYGVARIEQLFDPEVNLRTGMRHLKRLLEKYGAIGPAVMAYNAGEGALERSDGFVPYPETQRYAHRVLIAYLIRKGLAPYSQQARAHIGLDLRPEMAVAGSGATVDSAMVRRLLEREGAGALQETAPPPMPHSRRLLASRLSSRLETPSNSLLTSRLLKPKHRQARDMPRPFPSGLAISR